MNDDEVLGAMKLAVSEVRMDRPVEDIMRRGSARRRNRTAFGVAGGGLAVVAALAIALPIANGQQPATAPAAGAAGPVAMVPAGWTLDKLADNKVKLIMTGEQVTTPDVLQNALADAGIHAAVKVGVHCTPKAAELPQADKVYRTEVLPPDYKFTFIITPKGMPENSRLYFSLFNPRGGPKPAKFDVFLVSNDAPMNCVPQSSLQK